MRFPQLNIGDQFEYQGERWTRTGPLTAVRQSDGQSAMIPRYATVSRIEAVEQGEAEESSEAQGISPAELDRLLDVMLERIFVLLDGTAELSEDTREVLRSRLRGIAKDIQAMARRR